MNRRIRTTQRQAARTTQTPVRTTQRNPETTQRPISDSGIERTADAIVIHVPVMAAAAAAHTPEG